MEEDFLLSSYDYPPPPPELWAQRPLFPRHRSRLLVYDQHRDTTTHAHFLDLPRFLPPNSTLVFNDSKVLPLRLLGKRRREGPWSFSSCPPSPPIPGQRPS